jgi:acid stress-induced BolA-like protein IbaG/YrbA
MKTKILLAALVLFSLANQSFISKSKTGEALVEKKIPINRFDKLQLGKNVTVILVPAIQTDCVTVTGDAKNLELLAVSEEGGGLSVSLKKRITSGRLTVYIPVNGLSNIELGEDAHVLSQGFLNCSTITITVKDGSTVDIKNQGKVVVQTDHCDFVELEGK